MMWLCCALRGGAFFFGGGRWGEGYEDGMGMGMGMGRPRVGDRGVG